MPYKQELQTFLIKLFIDNPWMALVAFFVAIGGIVLTVIFGVKSLKKKLPMIEMKSNNLIDNFTSKYSGLKIELNGQNCENLTVTKMVFWNKGGDTILGNDIATLDKLSITPKDCIKIFSAEIIKVANEVNNFTLTNLDDYSKVLINFEYIDKNEGVVIQIVHSGKNSDDLLVNGSIKGFGKLRNNIIPTYFIWIRNFFDFFDNIIYKMIMYLSGEKKDSLENIKKRYKRNFMAIVTFTMPIIMTIIFLSPSRPKPDTSSIPLYQKLIMPLITFVLYYPMGFYLIKRKVPKKLDLF